MFFKRHSLAATTCFAHSWGFILYTYCSWGDRDYGWILENTGFLGISVIRIKKIWQPRKFFSIESYQKHEQIIRSSWETVRVLTNKSPDSSNPNQLLSGYGATRGEICHSRHFRRHQQCKFFASVVNFYRKQHIRSHNQHKKLSKRSFNFFMIAATWIASSPGTKS